MKKLVVAGHSELVISRDSLEPANINDKSNITFALIDTAEELSDVINRYKLLGADIVTIAEDVGYIVINYDTIEIISRVPIVLSRDAFTNLRVNSIVFDNIQWGVITTHAFKGLDAREFISFNGCDMSKAVVAEGMLKSIKTSYLDFSNVNLGNCRNLAGLFAGVTCTELNLTNTILGSEDGTDITQLFKDTNIETLYCDNLKLVNPISLSFMFNNADIRNIEGIEAFNNLKAEYLNLTFANAKVNGIDINTWDVSNCKAMRQTFADCKCNFKHGYNLSNWKTSNCEEMEAMFSNANILELILGEGWDTSKVTGTDAMFKDVNLEKLSLEHFNFKNVHSADSMFEGANIKHIENIEKLYDMKPYTARGMFREFVTSDTLDLTGLNLNKTHFMKNGSLISKTDITDLITKLELNDGAKCKISKNIFKRLNIQKADLVIVE